MTHRPTRSSTRPIVAGYDGRAPADRALEWAAQEARATGRRLTLVEVVTIAPPVPRPGLAGVAPLTAPTVSDVVERATTPRAAERLAARFPDLSVDHVELRGDAAVELAQAGRHAALVVVGSRGEGALRNLPSAQVGTRLARLTTCPVAVVPHHRLGRVRRGVLAGVSVRKHAPEVLDLAYAYADAHHLPLTIVHADHDTLAAPRDERVRWLAEAVSGHAAQHPDVRVEVRVATGRPARTLLRLAADKHLLVVGQHGAGELNLLGHVRGSVVDRSPCPVVVVPPLACGPRLPW